MSDFAGDSWRQIASDYRKRTERLKDEAGEIAASSDEPLNVTIGGATTLKAVDGTSLDPHPYTYRYGYYTTPTIYSGFVVGKEDDMDKPWEYIVYGEEGILWMGTIVAKDNLDAIVRAALDVGDDMDPDEQTLLVRPWVR